MGILARGAAGQWAADRAGSTRTPRSPTTTTVPTTAFFGWFNRVFDRGTNAYVGGVGGIIRRPLPFLLMFVLLIGGVYLLFVRLPSSFLPEEDQGVLMTMITLPQGATQARTVEVVKEVERHFLEDEKANVDGVFAAIGFGFNGSGQNSAMAFVKLKDFDDRKGKDQSASAIAGRAMAAFSKIRDAQVFALSPPACPISASPTASRCICRIPAAPARKASRRRATSFWPQPRRIPS